MVFPSGFIRLVASGTTVGGSEIWSTSWSIRAPFTSGDRADEIEANFLPGAVAAIRSWFTSADACVHTTATLDLVKANMVGPDGRYVSSDETVLAEVAPPVNGGKSGSFLPPQCTVAVSLLTGSTRGLAHRGRFYPPATAVGVDSATGGLVQSEQQSMATAAATLISALNAIEGYEVIVASDTREGAFRAVTAVEVGSVIDTQRRRRSALPEQYLRAAVTPG